MKSNGGLIVNVCIASVIVTVYWGSLKTDLLFKSVE